jgi:hypothetical protein
VTAETFERETVEFLPVNPKINGVAFTGSFQVCIKPYLTRPDNWAAAVEVGGQRGIMIQGLTTGTYTVWAKITDNPEIPVIDCGYIFIT